MSRRSYLSKTLLTMSQIFFSGLLICGIALFCAADEKKAASPADGAKVIDTTSSKDEVTLVVKSYEDIMKTIKEQKGKVVVMDCWATFCGPCKKEFPHLIELSNKYPRDKVQCVSLSFDNNGVDPIEKNLPKIKEFLVAQKASKLLNFVTEDESDLLYEKDRLDFIAIPAVFVYDKAGKLAKRFDNSAKDAKPFTYADVEKLVEELSAAK